jgi:uncharacterized membrane protein YkvA (DUF1232 family)
MAFHRVDLEPQFFTLAEPPNGRKRKQNTGGVVTGPNESAFYAPLKPLISNGVAPPKTKARKKQAKRPAQETRPASAKMQSLTVRSRAFGKAILNAKPYLLSPQRLEELIRQAAKQSAALPREPFRESWAYFHAMLRLLNAYQNGSYDKVPAKALLSIVAAVAYLVDPIDFIPDEIPFLGFLDDATVLEFAMQKTRRTLDDFMAWELKKLLAR